MKSFYTYIIEYQEYLKGTGLVKDSIHRAIYSIKKLFEYLNGFEINDIRDVTKENIISFIKTLEQTKTIFKTNFKFATIQRYLNSIKRFFNWLFKNEYLILNPVEDLEVKINGVKEKREIFLKDEMETFLKSLKKPLEKSIFELAYSSGLRISEIVNLELSDVDLKARTLHLKQAKGRKDRYVPFGKIARKYLEEYIKGGRKELEKRVFGKDKNYLFINVNGKMNNDKIKYIFNQTIKKSEVPKRKRSFHSIRHSVSTHLLEAGVGVVYVSELLGHESLETTVRYTSLVTDSLKKAYKKSHPRENDIYEEVDEKYLDEIEKFKNELLAKIS